MMSVRGKLTAKAAAGAGALREKAATGTEVLRDKASGGMDYVQDRAPAVTSTDWLGLILARMAPPPGRAERVHDLSLAAAIVSLGNIPGPIESMIRKLDAIGQVHVSPVDIGFDGTVVPWSAVVEIRLHNTENLIPSTAIDAEIEKIKHMLPPFPGRKALIRTVVGGLLTLVLSALERSESDPKPLPCEVVYRGSLGRAQHVGGGLFALAALQTVNNLADVIVATAHAHGKPVVVTPDSAGADRADRAQRLRAAAAGVRDRMQTRAED